MTRKPVTPQCCDAAKKHATVRLRMDEAYYYTDGGAPEGLVPKWQARAPHPDYGAAHTVAVDVAFCPHCAAPVPEVRRKARPPKVCVVTDGGYYCDTCKERLMACQCRPPEDLFEVAR